LDVLQQTVFVVLLLALVLPFLFMGKKAVRAFLKTQRTGELPPLTLKDAVTFIVCIPTSIAAGMGAWWVFTFGLEGLGRVLLLSGVGALVFTMVMLPFFYICRAISRWELKRKKQKSQ